MLLVLLKSAALLVVAVLVGILFRSSSASMRRLVYGASIVGALALPLFALVLPAWGVFRAGAVEHVQAAAEVALPSIELNLPAEEPLSAEEMPAAGEQTVVGASSSVAGQGSSPSAPPVLRVTWSELLVSLWLGGALILLMRLTLGLALSRRWRLARSEAYSSDWDDSLEEAVESLGLADRRISLSFKNSNSVPMVIGVVNPVICLPLEALVWRESRRRAVLTHELAHVRNYDNIYSLLGQLLCALHWFNPASWWLVRQLDHLSERAADDIVLATGIRPSEYALELLEIVRESGREGKPLWAVTSTMARASELRSRIGWILDPKHRKLALSPTQRIAFWSFCLGAVALLSCLGEAEPDRALSDSAGMFHVDESSSTSTSSTPLIRAVADYYGVSASGVELTIDEPLQGIVDDEVRALVDRYDPTSVSVVAIDPCNGQILALGSHGEGGVSRSLQPIEPGSTMKPITIAAALEEGMSPEAVVFCGNGSWAIENRTVRDASRSGWLGVAQIVSRSSNIGTGHIYQESLGWDRFQSWLLRFRIGERPTLPIAAITAGSIPAEEGSELRGVLAANGVGLRTSPVQLTAAYAALANDGIYHIPTLVRRVEDDRGEPLVDESERGAGQRLVSQVTAQTMMDMLSSAVELDEGTGRRARVDGLEIAGKTGTMLLSEPESDEPSDDIQDDDEPQSSYYASFVGIVEPDDSHLVLFVGVEGVRGGQYWGGQVAAPAFARIVSRAQGRRD